MKKVLTIILATMILIMALPCGILAVDEPVAKITNATNPTGTEYTTLADAFTNVNDGDTLTLLRDITLPAQITKNNVTGSYTFDGNGKKITAALNAVYAFYFIGGDTVTLKNLTLVNTSGRAIQVTAKTMVVDNCSLTAGSGNGISFGGGKVLELRDSIVTANQSAIETGANTENRIVNVYNSYLTNTTNNPVINLNKGNSLNFYSGSVIGGSGTVSPVILRTGDTNYPTNVNIYGGYFEYTPTSGNCPVIKCDNGCYATVKVYGGYILNKGSGRVMGSDTNDQNKMNANIYIYGGTFETKSCGVAVRLDAPSKTYAYGGTYIVNGAAGNNISYAVAGTFELKGGYNFAVKAAGGVDGSVLPGSPTNSQGLYVGSKATPVIREGASVRVISGSNGIRFTSDINKETIDYANSIKDADTNLSYGTVICPTKYLSGLGTMTMDTLASAGKTYENIDATNTGTTINSDGSLTIRASLVNLPSAHYSESFSAVPYVKLTVNGNDVYIYGAYDSQDNSRNIKAVASAAIADIKTTSTGFYTNPVTGGFSPYTEAQIAVLNGYLN